MNIPNNILPSDDFLGTGLGYLIVRVTTARGAVPIPDATVDIRDNNLESTDIIFTMKTDRNGMTSKIALPAPGIADLTSSTCVRPYYPYIIDVQADGYYPQTYLDVTVYDGITSYQTADLIPLSEQMTQRSIMQAKPEIIRNNTSLPPMPEANPLVEPHVIAPTPPSGNISDIIRGAVNPPAPDRTHNYNYPAQPEV